MIMVLIIITTDDTIKLDIVHLRVSWAPLSPYPLFLSAAIKIASKVYSTILLLLSYFA